MNDNTEMQIHVNQSIYAFIMLILITLGGFGMVIWGFKENEKAKDFKAHAIETVGVVVDYRETENDDGDDIYYAEFEYTVNGDTYIIQDDDYSVFEPELGETEVLYYDPRQPSEAKTSLDSSMGTLLIGTGSIFGLVGLAFVLARLGANKFVIKILLGVMLIIMGFVLPFALHTWLFIIIVKTI